MKPSEAADRVSRLLPCAFPHRAVACLLAVALQSVALPAAITGTFTANTNGTFPNTLHDEAPRGQVTVDLSRLPKDASIFRAELVLRPPAREGEKRPVSPTRVYPADAPERTLSWVAPRFLSLDALPAVQAALAAGTPLALRVESTGNGIERLDVSYAGRGSPRALIPKVSNLQVTHREGQALIVFTEPPLEPFPEFNTGRAVRAFVREFKQRHATTWFHVWRSAERITPATIAQAKLVGQLDFFTAWNAGYHQDDTDKRPPLRYRVTDLGAEVPWGTGIYAHNPDQAGPAFYAVTVVVNGEEDFTTLGGGNTTSRPVTEQIGPGAPILQWVETPREWHYRQAAEGSTLTRLIFTRWEAWPRASRPSVPIDYLIAMGNDPRQNGDDPEYRAFKVEPAPVGLHLHCWGGSLNGGYGWWYNAHRGAVLMAANQIPYDWWTGYHEALGTAKSFGDGHVQPFFMDRMLAFLDWAATRWAQAPAAVSRYARPLDRTRVFAAGNSMGGSGAPMLAIRHGDRIAWCNAWVGVHVPADSPQFQGSYENSYGPREPAITMPDGTTSPWDWFSDVWWLRRHPQAETGFIIASNGKDDGAIGWPQAVAFARALQETRRPHVFNWALNGHGTRTLIGANFDLDVRTDQSLPAFTHCTLDGDLGTATPKSKMQVAAEQRAQAAEVATGKRRAVKVDPYDGDPEGALNAWLRWQTEDIVDTPQAWEITVVLLAGAPKDECRVDLTPRRLQQFHTPHEAQFRYTVTELQTGRELDRGTAIADAVDLLTLRQIPLVQGRNRVTLAPVQPAESGGVRR